MLGDSVSRTSSVQDRRRGAERPTRTVKFLLLMLELVLVAGVVYVLNVENRRYFFPVLCVMIGGFAVHAWLPARYRMTCFALLSAGCVPFVLGLTNGLWVLGMGGGLIGMCWLPVAFRVRVLLLVTAGVGLVALRAQWPSSIWPVLGSMFMFRLMIYVVATRKGTGRRSCATAVSYFFLAPIVCFPLFPVAD